MKFQFALYPFISPLVLLLLYLLIQCSNGSNLVRESCRDASKGDPNISYDFCIACLEATVKIQPTRLEELVSISMKLTKSNATNIVSNISKLLKDQKFSPYAKACLKDCFDLYSYALSELEDAMDAFESKDFSTASINVSAAMDSSVTCEDQFKQKKGETSPLTKDNNRYFQLVAMSLAFIQMCR